LIESHLREPFEALKPNEGHQQKLLDEIIVKSKMEQRRPLTRRHFRFGTLVAAAMIFVLATTAYAGGYLGLDVKWLSFLSPSNNEQGLYLDNGALEVNKQAANKDGKLEVKQIIGDSNLIYILMDFTAPEGTNLNAKRYRFETSLSQNALGLSSTYSYDYTLLEDDNPNDNKISLVMNCLLQDNKVAGQEVTLMLSNLEEADVFPDQYETLIRGSWKIPFKMDYSNMSTTYPLNQAVSLYGYKAAITTLSISPISVTLKLGSAYTKEISDAARQSEQEIGPNEYSDSYPLTIKYKDGTSETTAVFNGMVIGDHSDDTITIVKPFTPIMNTKEIESVVFFGVEIEV
jgi:hypothetical protein